MDATGSTPPSEINAGLVAVWVLEKQQMFQLAATFALPTEVHARFLVPKNVVRPGIRCLRIDILMVSVCRIGLVCAALFGPAAVTASLAETPQLEPFPPVKLTVPPGKFGGTVQLEPVEPVKLTVQLDRTEYFLGENIPLHLTIENTGTRAFIFHKSGSVDFKITATNAAGKTVYDPMSEVMIFSLESSPMRMDPGSSSSETVPLNSRCRFTEPGKYAVTITPDPDWQKGWWHYPVAHVTVSLRMPTEAEAARLVTEKAASPGGGDFNSLCLPVYLAPLVECARTGNRRTLEAIRRIATPDATRALIDLAQTSADPFTLDIAIALRARLPNAHEGFMAHLRGTDSFLHPQPGVSLWDDRFAPEVRALARKWLERPETRFVAEGANMLELLGDASDATRMLAMLDQMLTAPSQANSDKQKFGNESAPLGALAHAVAAIRIRERIADDADPLTLGAAYVYFSNLWAKPLPRDPRWKARLDAFWHSPYARPREAAIRSIPFPPPAECAAIVTAASQDPDEGVRNAARFVSKHEIVIGMNFPHGPKLPPQIIHTDGKPTMSGPAWEVSAYDATIAQDPNNVDAYNNRGLSKYAQGDFDGALADFNHVIELRPKRADPYLNRGRIKSDRGDLPGAIADYDTAIALDPHLAMAFNNRGVARMVQGDYASARSDFDRAIDLDLNLSLAYANRSDIERIQNQIRAAIQDVDHAIELDPHMIKAYGGRALAKDIQGDFVGASADYTKRLELKDRGLPFMRFFLALDLRRQHLSDLPAGLRLEVPQWPVGWTKTVGRFLIGDLTESEFLAEAKAGEPKESLQHQCEADYFSAMNRVIGGDRPGAISLLQACLATSRTNSDEYMQARAELARLSPD